MKTKIWVLIIINGFLLSCNKSSKTNLDNRIVLSPDVWLQYYNEAWAICDKQIPYKTLNATNYFDPDIDISNTVDMITERTKKVEELVKTEFPELYNYTMIPEYQAKLIEQGQNVFNSIFQKNQAELDQLDRELDEQVKRNQRDLELEKQRMELFLKNYKAPEFLH